MPDEGKLVHIVKTNLCPTFFKERVMDVQKAAREFAEFLTVAQMFIDQAHGGTPHLELPILAITDRGYHTPWSFQDLLNVDLLPISARGIYEILVKAINGEEVGFLQKGKPVSAIIDFTNSSPALLGAYAQLTTAGYDLREVRYIGTAC